MGRGDGLRMNAIAAVCGERMGMGKNGGLPWRLPNEFAFFRRQTTATRDPSKRNAVLMGRLCWEGIPAKFRPLPDRLNVVLSRTLTAPPHADVLLCASVDEAMARLNERADIETVWNIGGAKVYEAAFEWAAFDRLFLTRIDADFDCDVFFPRFDTAAFRQVFDAPDVPADVQTEKGVSYRFFVYEKLRHNGE